MSVWQLILLASIVVLALKVSGYLVPAAVLERPMPSRIANLLTVALLAALVVTQTLASGNAIVIDARVPALVVAAGLLVARAPFIVVVAAAAVTAMVIRALT